MTAKDLAGNSSKVVTKTTTKSSKVVMVLATGPTNVPVGSTMPSVVVRLQDGFGHNLALENRSLTVTIPGATFDGTDSVATNGDGQAIFYDLTFQSVGGCSTFLKCYGRPEVIEGRGGAPDSGGDSLCAGTSAAAVVADWHDGGRLSFHDSSPRECVLPGRLSKREADGPTTVYTTRA